MRISEQVKQKLNDPKKIAHVIVVATKPDIIKQAPIYLELQKREQLVFLCHTGQHHDFRYSDGVLKEFGIKEDFNLEIDGTLNQRYSQMIERFEEVIDLLEKADKKVIPYVHGDTATAGAISMASILKRVACVHVEAGIRTLTPNRDLFKFMLGRSFSTYQNFLKNSTNYERGSLEPYPEQYNTRIVAPSAGLHCVPTELARENLITEGFDKEKIVVVGNTIVDSLRENESKQSTILDIYPMLKTKEWIPFFIHRRELCEDRELFENLIEALDNLIQKNHKIFLISLFAFENALARYGLEYKLEEWRERDNVIISDAITFHADMIQLMKHSKIFIMDSGSMQEELSILKVPAITVRFGSDRPETLLAGSNVLAPISNVQVFSQIVEKAIENRDRYSYDNLYRENVSKTIVDEVLSRLKNKDTLFITEKERTRL